MWDDIDGVSMLMIAGHVLKGMLASTLGRFGVSMEAAKAPFTGAPAANFSPAPPAGPAFGDKDDAGRIFTPGDDGQGRWLWPSAAHA